MKISWKRFKNSKADNYLLSKEQIESIKSYWKQYGVNVKLHDFQYYTHANGIFSTKYIPDYIYYSKIALTLNDKPKAEYLDDKNMYDMYFHDINMPKTIIRKQNGLFLDRDYNVIDESEALDLCKQYDKVFVKQSKDSSGGSGIYFGNVDEEKVKTAITTMMNIVVQEPIRQHVSMSNLHPSSINTIRVISVCIDGETFCIPTMVRMGKNKSFVDNAGSGGICVGVEKDGSLKKYGHDEHGIRHELHPDTNVRFSDVKIPRYKEIEETAIKLHNRFSDFSILGWDFYLDENCNIGLIEVNMSCCTCCLNQTSNGPMFGDKTDLVLEKVYKRKFHNVNE